MVGYLCLFLLSGCQKADPATMLVGRWSEDKHQRTIEFSSSGLYGISSNGETAEVGKWRVQDETIALERLTDPEPGSVVHWNVAFDRDVFDITEGDSFYRRFTKIQQTETPKIDQRFIAIWRQDSKLSNVLEFTSSGGFLGAVWRKSKEGRLTLVAMVGRADISATSFTLYGQMGEKTMFPIPHRYELQDGKLTWVRPKLGNEVYRKVSAVDIVPSSAPSAVPTP